MKRKFLIIIFIALLTGRIYAQAVIKGKVIDSTNTPVAFASVALLNSKDSLVVKGSVCNDKGEYSFERTPAGSYIVKALMVGADATYSLSFYADSINGFQVPDITIRSKGIELKEVAITSMKETIEFKDGMVIMNVENNPITAGNTVLDLLKKLPGVFADDQCNISIDGKAGVKILLDGRVQQLSGQQLAAILGSMSSEAVSKIEVMKNPPVKYDAAGTAGMINIVSKKVRVVGMSGSISATGMKGHSYSGNLDGALNYKGKKVTLFSNFGYANRVSFTEYIWDRAITSDSGTTHMDELGVEYFYYEPIYFKLGGTADITGKTTLGFLVNGGPVSTPFTDEGINQISGYNDLGFDHSDFFNDVRDDWSNPNFNINAEQRFDTLGTMLNFSADYANYTGTRNANSNNPFSDINDQEALPSNVFKSMHETDIKIHTQKLDFSKNITKILVFETGAKNTIVNSHNTYTFEKKYIPTGEFILDTSVSNENLYLENIMAGYVNFKRELQNGSFQVGARGENTLVDNKNKTTGFFLKRNYFNFFPNISLDYFKSDNHKFQFNISRRIDRPNYKDLNPFKSYQDNFSVTIGNPYLLPQTSYNFTFTYTYKRFLTNTFTYSRYSNYILSSDFQDDTSKATISSQNNLKRMDHYAYTVFIQKKFIKWWNCTMSGSVFYSLFKGSSVGTELDRSIASARVNMNHDFILPKNFKIIINGFYSGPSIDGARYTSLFWGINTGIRKTLLKDQLAINISVSDIFHTSNPYTTSKIEGQEYYLLFQNDTRRLRFNIQYKFGKIKVQKREVLSNDDEKSRLENKLQ